MQSQWEKKLKIDFGDNLVRPILTALKDIVENEKLELEKKLQNLKRLGVISINKEQLNKELEDLKIGKNK